MHSVPRPALVRDESHLDRERLFAAGLDHLERPGAEELLGCSRAGRGERHGAAFEFGRESKSIRFPCCEVDISRCILSWFLQNKATMAGLGQNHFLLVKRFVAIDRVQYDPTVVVKHGEVQKVLALPLIHPFGCAAFAAQVSARHVVGGADQEEQDENRYVDADQNRDRIHGSAEDIADHRSNPCV